MRCSILSHLRIRNFKATYIAIKRETVSKEVVYIAMGIREDGFKEVLSYEFAPTELIYIWKELLQDVKQRGTEQILLFISNGHTGL